MHRATAHGDRATAQRRHGRLPPWALAIGLSLLGLSFVSGIVVWLGQSANASADPQAGPAFPVGLWVSIHGALNPFLCGFLGYLTHQHIRVGWRQGANRPSGTAMLLVFGGLAVTGTALYYAAGDASRAALIWMHRALGLALPVTLALHWIAALRWVRALESSPSPPGPGSDRSA